jgi:hypothetical protein
MLDAGYSWRLYFYVLIAFSGGLFILAFFFAEETSYDRDAALAQETTAAMDPATERISSHLHDEKAVDSAGTVTTGTTQRRQKFFQTLSPAGRVDHEFPFFLTIIRSFSYFLVPHALWVITTYGIVIGLGTFAMSLTFPTRIMQPPYNWDVVSLVLACVANTRVLIYAIVSIWPVCNRINAGISLCPPSSLLFRPSRGLVDT